MCWSRSCLRLLLPFWNPFCRYHAANVEAPNDARHVAATVWTDSSALGTVARLDLANPSPPRASSAATIIDLASWRLVPEYDVARTTTRVHSSLPELSAVDGVADGNWSSMRSVGRLAGLLEYLVVSLAPGTDAESASRMALTTMPVQSFTSSP